MTIIRDITQPPGGWRFTVPETGFSVTAATAQSLRGKIAAHLRANGHPVPTEDALNAAICAQMQLGDPYCREGQPEPHEGLSRADPITMANRFMRTLMRFLKKPSFVSREEAQRRMDVCMGCPLSTNVGACWGCNGLFNTVSKLLPADRPRSNEGHEWCGACWCRIDGKVWFPNGTLDAAEQGDLPAYWDGCWRLNSSNV